MPRRHLLHRDGTPEDTLTERVYAVDRIEGRGRAARVILIDDDQQSVELPRALLGPHAVERAVLRVPLRDGTPVWTDARRDRDEERRRIDETTDAMRKLRARDPGGDLIL